MASLALSSVRAEVGLSPTTLIEQTAQSLADRVTADRSLLQASPPKLYSLVDEVLLPVFDTRYTGQLVLGRHGRDATPEQRRDFIATFYDYLVRSYASNVLKFTSERMRVFSPSTAVTKETKRTVVRTQMRLDDGTTASVDYSLRNTADGWRIYDVRIEGISYVQTFRNQFDAEIADLGLDAVIARLQADAARMGAPVVQDNTQQ